MMDAPSQNAGNGPLSPAGQLWTPLLRAQGRDRLNAPRLRLTAPLFESRHREKKKKPKESGDVRCWSPECFSLRSMGLGDLPERRCATKKGKKRRRTMDADVRLPRRPPAFKF